MNVFWSWQSDFAPKECRNVIRTALTLAVDALASHPEIEESARPSLDHDTKGVPGMVDIAQTILDKIARAAAVVADVTPIAQTAGGKYVPNPNVMIELGWAMQAPGLSQIVVVLNTASGCSIEELPFDIRHRRVMTYHLPVGSDSAQRKAVTDRLSTELTEALKLNLQTFAARQAAPAEDAEEVAPKAADRSIWASAGDRISFIDRMRMGSAEAHILLEQGPRCYVRVCPQAWVGEIPTATDLIHRDDIRPWPNLETAGSGNYGLNEDGALYYWITGQNEAKEHTSHSVAMYFERTGEFWFLDGRCFFEAAGRLNFYLPEMLRSVKKNAETGIGALSALGASADLKIEAGVVGLKKSVLQQSWRGIGPARKDEAFVSEMRSDWPEPLFERILAPLAGRVCDAFGLPKPSPARISELMRTGTWD